MWRLTGIGAFFLSENLKLADATMVYWDVLNSNDIETLDAAEHLAALIIATLSL